jgi:exonuclease SbcC
MRVEFTFELEGNRYRVLRQRKAGKRGRSVLDLQIADPQGQFRSISESTMRQTQAKIDGLLRLDYKVFGNSSFLRQGRADEFTVKTPGERKQILADILGLDQWAVYEERVKERVKQTQQQLDLVAARLDEIQRELDQEERYKSELSAAQAETLRLSGALRQAEADLHDVQAARQELGHKRGQLDDLKSRLARGERELATTREELAQAQARVESYKAVLAESDEIAEGYARWQQARESDAAFNASLAEQNALLQGRAALEATLAQARSELLARQSALQQQISELERRAAGAQLQADLETAQDELAELAQCEAERDALQARLTTLGADAAERRANGKTLKDQGTECSERLEQVGQIAGEESGPVLCPLCDQELSEQHRADLLRRLEAERESLRTAWRENQEQLKALNAETRETRLHLDQLTGELKRQPALQRRAAELAQRLDDAGQALDQLAGARKDLDQVQAQLEGEDYAPGARRELQALQAKMDALDYDAQAHRAAQDTLAESAPFEVRQAQLKQAQDEIEAARAALQQSEQRQSSWLETLDGDRATQSALQQQIAQLEEQLADAEQVENEVEGLRRQESTARMRLGAAQQRLDACQALKKQRQERQEEQNRLAGERAIYDELRVALGKKGVPAMIIEAAIPEIEAAANALLARMSDGRMHVRFETQREKVSGGVSETLDIQISDELGTRNYELYSGGEAFRINFAIRIALSQLLARRAGARLRTLVIDEGFGTQDTQGRQRLVEAINAIQADFDRILVITHISELQDAFPARIEITKTPQGSQIEVV